MSDKHHIKLLDSSLNIGEKVEFKNICVI